MLRKLFHALNPWVRSQRTVSRLLEQLESSDQEISKAAQKSLESIFYPNPFAEGPRFLAWADYSAMVLRHHRRIRASSVAKPLLDVLASDRHAARLFAIRALAANQEPRALNAIVAALQDQSAEIRAAAAIQLMHYRDQRTVGPLIALLMDAEEEPRQFAANTLGFIADPQATGPLLGLLESRHWRDRESALYALRDICGEAALPTIRRHLRDPAKRVRKAAKAALAGFDRRRRATLARPRPDW